MNEQINDGGPAFPVPDVIDRDRNYYQYGGPGMTLRDYFAAKAMQGDIASMRAEEDPLSVASEIAERAYFVADAMLAARGDA